MLKPNRDEGCNILQRRTEEHISPDAICRCFERSWKLVGGKQWHGIGHTGMNQGSSFLTSKDDGNARALAAKLRIPWDEWVKIHGVCHYCREKGHIHPKMPQVSCWHCFWQNQAKQYTRQHKNWKSYSRKWWEAEVQQEIQEFPKVQDSHGGFPSMEYWWQRWQ